jgi:glycosyltransferase involved in cell wall biosynthesis
MTKLGLRPYRAGDAPSPGSVPVSVVVLTLNEEPNIARCMASLAWADQVVVVDSGSSDGTIPVARSMGAEVVEQPWLGFSAQREHALRLPLIRNDWVYFVDADEWVCPELAAEIAARLADPRCGGFAHRLRLVFMGTWIRHCGWYGGSWVVRLVDRRFTKYDGNVVGERACVDGRIRRLCHDIVDEDRKGLAAWLHKHVRYAQLEGERRGSTARLPERLHALRDGSSSRPLVRGILKELIFPGVPAKPAAIFLYCYVARLGFLDGVAGLRFCLYHAWFEMTVASLRADNRLGHVSADAGDGAVEAPDTERVRPSSQAAAVLNG